MLDRKETRYYKLKTLAARGDLEHNQHTPSELVDEMLDLVAYTLTEDAKILTLNPEFAVSLIEDYPFTAPNVVMYTAGDDNLETIAGGMGINTIQELETDMNFDVVLGNPPFQKGHSAKRWTLWQELVEKAFELSPCVAFVTPQSITGPRALEQIKGASVLNLDVSKHFKVGSTFCYWVVDRSQPCEYTEVTTSEGNFQLDFSDVPFLPHEITDKNLELLNKLVSRETTRVWKRGEFHTTKKDDISSRGGVEVFHTNAQTLNVKKTFQHSNLNLVRVAVSLSGYPEFKVVKGHYCSQATLWTEFKTLKDAKAFAAECNGEEVQEMLKVYKWSGWNSKEVISLL